MERKVPKSVETVNAFYQTLLKCLERSLKKLLSKEKNTLTSVCGNQDVLLQFFTGILRSNSNVQAERPRWSQL